MNKSVMSIPALWRRITQTLLVVVMVWTGVGVAFPQTPNDVKVEIFHTGVWNNISTDVFDRATSPRITITRGRPDEGARCDPGYATLSINNRTGKYSPRNPVSPLYGKIGRNTPIRISVTHNAITYVRFVGEVTAWPSRWDLSQKDIWVPIEAYGILRRLGQGASALQSALFRTISGIAPNDYIPRAYWPMEDGSDATQFASGLSGGAQMSTSGTILLAAQSSLVGSLPLPTFSSGANATATIPAYISTDKWVLQFLMRIPVEPTALITIADITVRGDNIVRWVVELQPDAANGSLNTFGYDAAGDLIMGIQNGVPSDFYAKWWNYSLAVYKSGTDLQATMFYFDGLGTSRGPFGLTEPAIGPGTPTTVQLSGGEGDLSLGHLALFTDPLFDPDVDVAVTADAMYGHAGELATTRLQRLCNEEGVSLSIVGTTTATMGPQRVATLLESLDACAGADRGFLFEQRTAVGLAYRTNRSRFNQ